MGAINRRFGVLTVLVIVSVYMSFSMFPESLIGSDSPGMKGWKNLDYTFRLFLFVNLMIWGAASCLQIMKFYKVNYLFIFEVEPAN